MGPAPLPTRTPSRTRWPRAVALLVLIAAGAARAQFASIPAREPLHALHVSEATTAHEYRQDVARHFYRIYASRVYRGMLPPLLHAVMVTETQVDRHGVVRQVRVVRRPAGAKAVVPWVVSMIRAASPLPPPRRLGAVQVMETWLVDKSGRFQLHTLSEGQR